MQHYKSNHFSKFLIVIIVITLLPLNHLFAQGWKWANTSGGAASGISKAVVADRWGNVYVTGIFTPDIISFNGINLMNAGDQNIYLLKYNNLGNLLWAKRFGGIYTDGSTSITADTFGNIYLAGYFSSPLIIFDTVKLTNTYITYVDYGGNTSDFFVAKLDSAGNGIWARSAKGLNSEMANSVCVNALGNVFVAGSYSSDTLGFNTGFITKAGANDMFLVKYDSLGNLIWFKGAGGVYNDGAYSVSSDSTDNVFVCGNFNSPKIKFDSITLVNAGDTNTTNDIFIVKYDVIGNVIWAKRAGGVNDDMATSVITDGLGNVYLTGSYSSNLINFGGSTLTNTSAFGNMFIVKYNADGLVKWAKSTAITNYVYPQSATIDIAGNIYVTGYFSSTTVSFGSKTLTNVMSGYADVFLAKYDSTGNTIWAKSGGGSNDDAANSVTIDRMGNIYIAGYFMSPIITFGYITDTITATYNAFLAKFNEATINIPEINSSTCLINVYPNPATTTINVILKEDGNKHLSIIDCNGKNIYSIALYGNEKNVELDVRNYVDGIYLLIVQNAQGITNQIVFSVKK